MNFTTLTVVPALITLLACGDGPTEPALDDFPNVRALVVDSAAAALDSAGHFLFTPDIGSTAEAVPLTSASRARELAAAFTAAYGPAFQPDWERQRGGLIDLAALVPSARVYPARTSFGAVPDSGCHPAFVRLFGSYYLMTLDAGNQQQVLMAVSAQTTEYSVASDGTLVEPSRTGEDFRHDGIPADRRAPFVIGPEQAVSVVARATSAKVRQVPQLALWSMHSPIAALWRVELDHAVNVTRPDGERVAAQALYVGPNARLYLPLRDQPASVTLTCLKVDDNLVSSGSASITVPVLSGRSVDFEPVVLQPR